MINESTDVIPLNDDDIDVCYTCAIIHAQSTHLIVKSGDDGQSACAGIPRYIFILKDLIISK